MMAGCCLGCVFCNDSLGRDRRVLNILLNSLFGFFPIDMSSHSDSLSTHDLLFAADNSDVESFTVGVFGIVTSGVQDL